MTAKNDIEGYLLSQAISALRTVGSGVGDGWSYIREYWEMLAEGGTDPLDAASWAEEIAKRVVRDVLKAEPEERPKKALVALGLVGVERGHRKEREYVYLYEDFRLLAKEAGHSSAATRRQFAQQMLDGGYFEGLSVEQAMNSIDYIKKTRPRKK